MVLLLISIVGCWPVAVAGCMQLQQRMSVVGVDSVAFFIQPVRRWRQVHRLSVNDDSIDCPSVDRPSSSSSERASEEERAARGTAPAASHHHHHHDHPTP